MLNKETYFFLKKYVEIGLRLLSKADMDLLRMYEEKVYLAAISLERLKKWDLEYFNPAKFLNYSLLAIMMQVISYGTISH